MRVKWRAVLVSYLFTSVSKIRYRSLSPAGRGMQEAQGASVTATQYCVTVHPAPAPAPHFPALFCSALDQPALPRPAPPRLTIFSVLYCKAPTRPTSLYLALHCTTPSRTASSYIVTSLTPSYPTPPLVSTALTGDLTEPNPIGPLPLPRCQSLCVR